VIRLTEALNCGAVLLHRHGHIVHVNARLCAMMQRGRDQLVDVNVLSLYESAEAQDFIRAALADFDHPRESELSLPLADGQSLPVIASARLLCEDPPLRDYAVVTLIDLTRQKAAEEDLRNQYRIISELSNTVLDQGLALKHNNEALEQRVRERTAELHAAQHDTVHMLAIASEAKDEDTGSHIRRLQGHVERLALRMGFARRDAEAMGLAAVLHDIGKIHVPDDILKKPAALTPEERRIMQHHTLAGERILSPSPHFAQAARIARSHHENYDGSGYPDSLAGGAIPIEARLVHLADVYDALVSPRVYKRAWEPGAAMEFVRSQAGRMFAPEVVAAFEAEAGEVGRG
jgi:response regulator RpfG family c-di-GMP phosphodiesterase